MHSIHEHMCTLYAIKCREHTNNTHMYIYTRYPILYHLASVSVIVIRLVYVSAAPYCMRWVCVHNMRVCLLFGCLLQKPPTFIWWLYDRRPRRYYTKCSRKFGTISEPNRFLLDARALLIYLGIFFILNSFSRGIPFLNFFFIFFMRRNNCAILKKPVTYTFNLKFIKWLFYIGNTGCVTGFKILLTF